MIIHLSTIFIFSATHDKIYALQVQGVSITIMKFHVIVLAQSMKGNSVIFIVSV